MSSAEARRLDAADPLRASRDAFRLPEGIVYLDGNSLGALPCATPAALARATEEEWGDGLVRSWNPAYAGGAGWIDLPRRVGDALAPLIGARPGEVIASDGVSANVFKLAWAALRARPGRKAVLSETGNFPTDIYMIDALKTAGLAQLRLVETDRLAEALDEDVALLLLTHVNFRTGAMHDMAYLTRAAHAAGALVLWDLSHSAGAVPVDLEACQADLAVGCGYKFLNGGPGAPGFCYVAARHIDGLQQPLSGWMGHADPFAFRDDYEPAPGIERLLSGTPPILGLTALAQGAAIIARMGMEALVAKSRAMSEFMRQQMAARVPEMPCASPGDPARRGSQLSFRHPQAYAICQALIARGVIGDFREPDLLRFGFAPAYNSFEDCFKAVEAVQAVIAGAEWQDARFARRAPVT